MPSRWLAALSTKCADISDTRIRELIALGVAAVVLNVHDAPSCDAARTALAPLPVRQTHVTGMKGGFWLQELGNVSGFDYVWLLDADVSPYAPPLTLEYLERWFHHARAGVLQPSVVAATAGARTSDKPELEGKLFREDCAAVCVRVEQMTPIFTAELWLGFHRQVLRRVPRHMLDKSDWGLGNAWTGFAHVHNRSSLVLRDTHVIHYDTRTYDRLLNATQPPRVLARTLREFKGKPLFQYMHQHMPHILSAASCRKRQRCFSRPVGLQQRRRRRGRSAKRSR